MEFIIIDDPYTGPPAKEQIESVRFWYNKIEEIMAKTTQTLPVIEDPWKHRSANMSCQTCMWFVLKNPSPIIGRCRKHAPTITGYPVVFTTDWCGDHKLDETKFESMK